jgi:hypothetical protein
VKRNLANCRLDRWEKRQRGDWVQPTPSVIELRWGGGCAPLWDAPLLNPSSNALSSGAAARLSVRRSERRIGPLALREEQKTLPSPTLG